MGEATSTVLLAVVIIAGTFYGTLRWIVQDGIPISDQNRGPS